MRTVLLKISFITFFLFLITWSSAFSQIHYSVPVAPWLESFGNHRAVLMVDHPGDQVYLDLEWRRHDPDPADKLFIIIEESTGDTIPILKRLEVNQERCSLTFGPVKRSGKYLFYYLPYQVQTGYGFYYGDYLMAKTQDPRLKTQIKQFESKARVLEIQARTEFDSFYPMEVCALASEIEELLRDHPDPFLVFPEDRKFPIRMQDALPRRWIESGPSNTFKGTALRNEYYVFQIGVWASKNELENLLIESTELQFQYSAENNNTSTSLPEPTCFNNSGIDPYGTPFTKQIVIPSGKVQALWFGIDIPENIPAGNYKGTITLNNGTTTKVDFTIAVLPESLPDRGDSETWRHSRLRWLNSTAGLDLEPVKPYGPVKLVSDNSSTTAKIKLDRHASGFPAQIQVNDQILTNPIDIQLQSASGDLSFQFQKGKLTQEANGEHKWEHRWMNNYVDITLESTLEFDGYQRYTISLSVKEPLDLTDLSLNIPFRSEIASYMMGMGLPGCETPDKHIGKWLKPQDSFWMGNEEGGLWCEIRGSSYHGPLQNLYKPGHPRPWYNDDKGYMSVSKSNHVTLAKVGTGPVEMHPGEEWIFEFALLPTPVKDLDPAGQFTNRYYHSGGAPDEVKKDLPTGIKILNVHHANRFNPYINYPFLAVDTLQGLIDQAHNMGLKLKIYYTIRELTNHVTEIWALRSLGDEILRGGNGGGYPWLREHFIDGYYPQWYQHFEDGSPDASCLTATTASRWYNYYIEGLRWLIKNQDIDGLYLDDVAFDRRILKRMRKVMEETKPDCLIDLHSNTGFSKGPAIQYTGYFPYVDKLWFGESFQYNKMPPDNWFVEVSGIPFGLMGDMLHGGGNRWLGMLFGMTVRLPWTSEGNTADPRPVWKFWDEFGIAEAEMIGFWSSENPIQLECTDIPGNIDKIVCATVYKKEDQLLIALGNFGEEEFDVKLRINWEKLGLEISEYELIAPYIKDFQEERVYNTNDKITIPKKEGCLLICREIK